MVQWLSMVVVNYLWFGCPIMDYTQDASRFIKSKQGDIDVGQHFINLQVHHNDRHALVVRYILTNNVPMAEKADEWWRFNAFPFGNRCSPYIACQVQSRILELCKGDTMD